MRLIRLLGITVSLATLHAGSAEAADVASVFNGRVPCEASSPGVGQVCSSAGIVNRAITWDGVPLDVTLTLPPPEMEGPFPLIVDLHGFAQGKAPSGIEQLVPQGYAVLIYSARGQHFSCGFVESRLPDPTLPNPNICTERGWTHVADARYEVRDTQYLAGLLVDQGLAKPDIGVTGISFGGGQSLMLAVLKNRTMMPDGTLVPWQSPAGVPMSVAAAAPLIGWSDLSYALVPNGHTLDYRALNPYGVRAGVMKQSYVDVLFDAGVPTAYYAPAGADPDADITAWHDRLNQGEPYDDDPLLQHALQELTTHHSGYYLDDSIEPAPLWIYNAFVDDIMPPVQALKFYNKTKSLYPNAEISVQFAADFAHPRGNLGDPRLHQDPRVMQHLVRHLGGTGDPLPGVEVYTQGCGTASALGPFTATDWAALRPGEVRLLAPAAQTFDSAGGDPANAVADDPAGPESTNACRTVATSADDPGAATYRFPVVGCAGYTLVGSPTVIADLAVTGPFAEIAARLWDVASDGSQTLVTHGLYRPRIDNLGPQVIQLEPGGWQFAVGHQPKLELLGQSASYGRPSNGTFTIAISNADVRLPVLESPTVGCDVAAPALPVQPPPAEQPIPTPTMTPGPGATSTPVIGATATPTATVTPSALGQMILGARLHIKNPTPDVGKRRVVGQARENFSANSIVGDPTVNGATLEVIANGDTDSDQSFDLPAAGWRRMGTVGFKYSNKLTGGAARKASIKRTAKGMFQIRVQVDGKDGVVSVVPPNAGNDGGFILTLGGGDRYCVGFGGAAGGREFKDEPAQWLMKNPTAEACPVPE